MSSMKRVVELSVALVLSRGGDVDTDDGGFATVDTDVIIELEAAIADAFELEFDEVTEDDVPIIRALLDQHL